MPSDPTVIERKLRFDGEDIDQFAAASGDRNPMHLEPAFARRTAFGQCIVQGALVSIGLLGTLPPEALERVRAIRVWFLAPVLPGTTSSVRASPHGAAAGAWEVRLVGRGKLLARLSALTSEDPGSAVPNGETIERALSGGPSGVRAMRTTPAERDVAELPLGHEIAGEYRTGPELLTVARRCGAEQIHPALLEGLAWSSYVVGMEIPGRYALFAGLSLAAAADQAACERQSIRLRDYDERTGRLLLEGVLLGGSGSARSVARIECFALAPVASPDAGAFGVADPAGALRGAVAVIGGSRGLGAALSLALLAAGYAVHAVYSSSSASAAELARLGRPHEGRLFLHRIDARDPRQFAPLLEAIRESGTPFVGLVLNAAPPPLPMGVTGESAGELAEYVAESLRLTAVPLGSLLPLIDTDGGWILFCSSSAITAPPRDWPHYVAAKGALEGLASWVAATTPQARTVVVRPPKLRTDLTNTPTGRVGAAPTGPVAGWVVERLAGGELPPGLSVLEPDGDWGRP